MVAVVRSSQQDLSLSVRSVKKVLVLLLDHLDIHTDQVTVHFVSEQKISALHAQFFEDPTPTDCITFPIDIDPHATPHILGEIFICPAVAKAYAIAHYLDPYQETLRYLIHGVLHLIGYDDRTPRDRARMRRKENTCLLYLEKQKASLVALQKKRKSL